jgi:uncharacterized protein YrrD
MPAALQVRRSDGCLDAQPFNGTLTKHAEDKRNRQEGEQAMAYLRDVLKRDMMALEEGMDLGRPQDFVIDPSKHTVVAVVLAHGSVPETWVVCKSGEVSSFSSDTLAVSSLQSIRLAFQDAEILKLIRSGVRLRGHIVLTQEGRKLGRITDADLDEKGKVAYYLVKKGILGWFGRRESVSAEELENVGVDVAVTKAHQA